MEQGLRQARIPIQDLPLASVSLVNLKNNPDFRHLKGVLTALQLDCSFPSPSQNLFPGKSLQWKKLLSASLQASLQEVLFTNDPELQQQALKQLHLWVKTRISLDKTDKARDHSYSPSQNSSRMWREQVETLMRKPNAQLTLATRSNTKLKPILPPLSRISELNRTGLENGLTSDSYRPFEHYLHKRLAESTKRARTLRLEPFQTPRSVLRSRIGRKPSPVSYHGHVVPKAA
jgi:hypothetical protein